MGPPVTAPVLLNLNLGMLKATEALKMSSKVTSALTNHPFFTNINLEPLQAADARLKESAGAVAAKDLSKIPQRDADLASVIKELTRIGFNLQLLAIDDETQLHNVGYEFQKHRTRTRVSRPPVTALTGFEVTNCNDPGEVLINATRQSAAFAYQFQYSDGDPSVEENWIDAGTHKGCTDVRVKGVGSLKRYTFRGRAYGDNGPGPWSALVTISVT